MARRIAPGTHTAAQQHQWNRLVLDGVSKSFPSRQGPGPLVLDGINLELHRGEFLCVLGPSGCGKTTLLNIIAGFEQPTTGTVAYDNRPIEGPGPDRVVVFQDPASALFPWMTALENTLFGPTMQGVPKEEAAARAQRYLTLVGLHEHQWKYPHQLSGGMKQRLQIARALACEPEIMLMDEPFAALDAINKRILQLELSRIWSETKKTIFYITHDIAEAMQLATRLMVMTAGPNGRIKFTVELDLERPRSAADPRFQGIQAQVEAMLEEEVTRVRGD